MSDTIFKCEVREPEIRRGIRNLIKRLYGYVDNDRNLDRVEEYCFIYLRLPASAEAVAGFAGTTSVVGQEAATLSIDAMLNELKQRVPVARAELRDSTLGKDVFVYADGRVEYGCHHITAVMVDSIIAARNKLGYKPR